MHYIVVVKKQIQTDTSSVVLKKNIKLPFAPMKGLSIKDGVETYELTTDPVWDMDHDIFEVFDNPILNLQSEDDFIKEINMHVDALGWIVAEQQNKAA